MNDNHPVISVIMSEPLLKHLLQYCNICDALNEEPFWALLEDGIECNGNMCKDWVKLLK